MSTHLPILRSPRRTDLDAAPGQTVFTLTDPVFDLADVAVWSAADGDLTWMPVATGYTLAFVAGQPGPVVATFAAPPRAGAGDPVVKIRLESRRLHERVTNATRDGILRTHALESDLDRNATVQQELRRDIDDAMSAVPRRLLDGSYDFAGGRVRNVGTGVAPSDGASVEQLGNAVAAAAEVPIFSSVLAMAAVTVKSHIFAVRVNGYAEPGDGGGGLAVSEPNGTAPWFTDAGGRNWYLARGAVRPEMFGAGVPSLRQAGVAYKAVASSEINLPAGRFVSADSITLGDGPLKVRGAAPVVYALTAGAPGVVAESKGVGSHYCWYDVTFALASTAGLVAGDVVVARPTGVKLAYNAHDETDVTVRHLEYSGAGIVRSVSSGTVTVRMASSQSKDKFPCGEGVAVAQITGGTLTKLPTVIEFTGVSGLIVSGHAGELTDVAIIGDRGGTNANGVTIDTTVDGSEKASASVGLFNCVIAGFSGVGISVAGAGASLHAKDLSIGDCRTHGVRVAAAASASMPSTIIRGCGDAVGNGFFALETGRINCPSSLVIGVRNSGFYANRAGSISCENSTAIGNGNWAEEVAEGFVQREGKGFEAESNGTIFCNNAVALFMTEMGFYANSGSTMCAFRAVSIGHMKGHGFYALMSGAISARYSVAKNNEGYGFYAYANSRIDAQTTLSSGNILFDYNAHGGSSIWVLDYLGGTTRMRPQLNVGGGNQIIGSGVYELGTKLMLTRGASLTVAAGAVAVTHGFHVVASTATNVTSDLNTITGGVDGMILVLRCLSATRKVRVVDNAGNIRLHHSGARLLSGFQDKLTLIYDTADAKWHELAYMRNSRDTDESERLAIARGAQLAIAANAVTVNATYHPIATGDSGTLATINGGAEGYMVILRALSIAGPITVKHNTGNIILGTGADRVLATRGARLTLLYDAIEAKWFETAYAANVEPPP